MTLPKLTLVLPAHNEAGVIAESVRSVDAYLRTLSLTYRIVVGDSASTDDTAAVVRALELPSVQVIHSPVPGKGTILSRCFRASEGEYMGFIDADMEIDVSYVGPMLERLEAGCDAVVASKSLDPGLNRHRPWSRRLNTAVYNGIVRLLFRTQFRDHQAGLKLFRSGPLKRALERVESPAWLWDTELLVALVRQGGTVEEYPIATRPREGSGFSATLNPLALARDLLAVYRRQRRA